MSILPDLLAEYAEVSRGLWLLEARRDELRSEIQSEMARNGLDQARSDGVKATIADWSRLRPRRDEVLGLLSASALYPFAHFTVNRVKQLLTPTYGRDRLLPLFDIEKRRVLRMTTGSGRDAHDASRHDEAYHES